MIKTKSVKKVSLSFVLVLGILLSLPGIASSQMKYDIKLIINEKVLFKNCVSDGSELYVSNEELALKIDGSVSIDGPFVLGPYFKFKKLKVSLIKTGSGKDAELNVKNTGVFSSEVKIITLDGKQHAFLPFEEFVAAASGGTRNYNKIIYR